MRTDVTEKLLEENELYCSKLLKMPVCICVNGTQGMKKYEYDLDNSLKYVIKSVNDSGLQKFVDMGIVSYYEGAEIKTDFKNVRALGAHDLSFPGEKPGTGECLYSIMNEISRKLGDYRINGNNYCKPVIMLITSAENEVFPEKIKRYITEKRLHNAVYIISIVIGESGEIGELKSVSDRVLKSSSRELIDILTAIVESMEHQSRSSTSSAYEELLDPGKQESWSRYLV